MDNAAYITLNRQSGLVKEMRVIANNIANAATTGYRAEGMIFSEYVSPVPRGESLSIGRGNVRNTSFAQGTISQTGGQFDFAIEGDGYFLVETPAGERLTRAGAFSSNADGDLVTYDGFRVLDSGGSPVFVPSGVGDIAVSTDGTVSVDGAPLGQLGIVKPLAPKDMIREDGVMFRADEGYEPATDARVVQGFVESANVDPISQIARMIEVQRAYEMGQNFLKTEDERIRTALKALTR